MVGVGRGQEVVEGTFCVGMNGQGWLWEGGCVTVFADLGGSGQTVGKRQWPTRVRQDELLGFAAGRRQW